MNFQLQTVDHIHVYVTNRDLAEKWYKDTLGFFRKKDLEFWSKDGGPLTLQNDLNTVHLALFEKSVSPGATVAFKIDAFGFLNCVKHLQLMNVESKLMDHEVSWSVYIRDPDKNPYEITTYEYQEVKKALPDDIL